MKQPKDQEQSPVLFQQMLLEHSDPANVQRQKVQDEKEELVKIVRLSHKANVALQKQPNEIDQQLEKTKIGRW